MMDSLKNAKKPSVNLKITSKHHASKKKDILKSLKLLSRIKKGIL